jgi:hypothetical protein
VRPAARRLVLALACGAALAGCAQRGPGPLYQWGSFPRTQYDTLRREGANPEEQIRQLEADAAKARGAGAALPPGFRAHLGMLYLNSGNAGQARQLWLEEKASFPESAPYMDPLLKRLEGGADAAKAPMKPGDAPGDAKREAKSENPA